MIELAGQRIGWLVIEPGQWKLAFQRDYLDAVPRPVVGQMFDDFDLRRPRVIPQALSYFWNLLPENGSWLSLELARQHRLRDDDVVGRLAFVGQDLPGALTLTAFDHDGELVDGRPVSPRPEPRSDGPLDLRMSLAGMQPKLSVDLASDHKVVVPASGLGGRWILKFASEQYPELPRVEHATMTLAREVGFEVPETRVMHIEALGEHAAKFEGMQSEIYLCRRFDRDGDKKVHQEDLAQALTVLPANKYTEGQKHDLVYVAKKLKAILGPEAVLPFFERLVFDVAIGNADAHLKNWSLLYRTPHLAELAPCYDLVPTILWLPQQRPALDWPGKPATGAINWTAFEKVLQQCKLNKPEVHERLRLMAARILERWTTLGGELGLSDKAFRVVDSHLRSVPLIRELTA